MQYPQWWERLLAGIIDGVIMAVVAGIIYSLFFAIGGWVLGFLAWLINAALFVAYKVFFESGPWQATPGKMVFGLKAVDESGARAAVQQALVRTWPWWLNAINAIGALIGIVGILSFLVTLAIVAIFCTFFMPPGGRCIHDTTAGMYVIKAGPGLVQTGA
jgi:uncharacterized RDD family membrane protein YckC